MGNRQWAVGTWDYVAISLGPADSTVQDSDKTVSSKRSVAPTVDCLLPTYFPLLRRRGCGETSKRDTISSGEDDGHARSRSECA